MRSEFRFANKAVRDLAWSIASPNLLQGPEVVTEEWCSGLYQKHHVALEALDQQPEPLLRHLREFSASTRLGIYFEALVSFWLGRFLCATDLSHNIPVVEDGRTIGAFDFLFSDPQANQLTHWETAVKYYLHNPDDGLFHGPNARDRLDLKVEKIFRQQLPLSRTLSKPHLARALVKGWLFYPLRSEWRSHVAPPPVSPTHARGWWARQNDFSPEIFGKDSVWMILERRDWLSPAVVSPGEASANLLSPEKMMAVLMTTPAENHSYALVAEMAPASDGSYSERSRGFIVGEYWPNVRSER